VGVMLRADPDSRPSTRDLLATSIVKKHLQLLLGMATVPKGPSGGAAGARRSSAGSDEWLPPQTPATPGPNSPAGFGASAAVAEAGYGGDRLSSSGGATAAGSTSNSLNNSLSGGTPATPTGAAGTGSSGSSGVPASLGATPPASRLSSVTSGTRVSVDLGDVSAAIKKMARTVGGGSSGSTTMKRSRHAAAAAAAAVAADRAGGEGPSTPSKAAKGPGGAGAVSMKRPGGGGATSGGAGAAAGGGSGSSFSSKRGAPGVLALAGGGGATLAADAALPSPVVAARKKVRTRKEQRGMQQHPAARGGCADGKAWLCTTQALPITSMLFLFAHGDTAGPATDGRHQHQHQHVHICRHVLAHDVPPHPCSTSPTLDTHTPTFTTTPTYPHHPHTQLITCPQPLNLPHTPPHTPTHTPPQVVKRWEASASWEVQQRKAAELRRAAALMEQRLAREQVRAGGGGRGLGVGGGGRGLGGRGGVAGCL
jgi:hypothetical protein